MEGSLISVARRFPTLACVCWTDQGTLWPTLKPIPKEISFSRSSQKEIIG